MRARGIVAVLVAGAFAGTATAAAQAAHYTEIPLLVRGSLRVAWHADPARCAAAGLCGYSGTVTYPVRGRDSIEGLGSPSNVRYFTGLLEAFGNAKARTERAVPGADPAVCTQHEGFSAFTLELKHAYRGHLWLTVDTDISPPPLVSGQCAGPRVEDIAPSLPSALVTPGQLERRGSRIDLAGRFPWRSGALRGQVISTVGLQTGRVHREKVNGHAPAPRGHELYVELRYRARRLQGEVRNDFRAVDAPICRVRDACGTHGSQVFSIESPDERIDVTGVARVRSRHKPSLRRAVRTVLRHGSFGSFSSLDRDAGLSSHVLVRPGATTCNDRFRPRTGPFMVLFGYRRKLALDMYSGDSEVLRGRCPGPTGEQGGGAGLGHARLSSKAFFRRTIQVQLKARRAFAGGAYRGMRSARVNLVLQRTGTRVSVDPKHRRRTYLFAFSSGFSSGTTSARSAP